MKEWFQSRAKRAVTSLKQDKLFYIFALLSMLAAGLYVLILHDRMFPLAEGWYTYYAKCIHDGILPYRDFEYLYPPVYMYTVALITKLFGFELIVLRRMGILVFALISLAFYLCAVEIVGKKRCWIALIAALSAAFYLQTEVVQTFYDYIRIMDVFSSFALLFLLRAVKNMAADAPHKRDLIACSVLCAVFVNTKQNMGLIFYAFALVLVFYTGLWCRRTAKDIRKDLACFVLPFLGVMALVFLALACSGSLSSYLAMTGLSAAGAKGGIAAVLFGWLKNNAIQFRYCAVWSTALLLAIVGLFFLQKRVQGREPIEDEAACGISVNAWIGIAFGVLLSAGLIVLALSERFAKWLLPAYFLNPYGLFAVILPLFVACGIWGIVDVVKKRDTMRPMILLFSLAGAYVALAFGCANSGGIAEGQSGTGILLLVVVGLLFCENILGSLAHKHIKVIRYAMNGVLVLVCLVLTLHHADKKMVYTYNWWGMDESDYWSSTEVLDVPLTKGITVSAQTKALYEGVYRAVTENTERGDAIFCFPQIPIFYNLCDRSDPGTYTKVQWFDVAGDDSVRADIEFLRENPPKAIVIYNTSEYAYQAHENAFRGGNTSATREMREFLYDYVADNGYRFCGDFKANNNSVSVWVKDLQE